MLFSFAFKAPSSFQIMDLTSESGIAVTWCLSTIARVKILDTLSILPWSTYRLNRKSYDQFFHRTVVFSEHLLERLQEDLHVPVVLPLVAGIILEVSIFIIITIMALGSMMAGSKVLVSSCSRTLSTHVSTCALVRIAPLRIAAFRIAVMARAPASHP